MDLQRPGQGSEACFFDTVIPVETIISTEAFLKHLTKNYKLQGPVTVIAPNSEVIKKAKKYQRKLQEHLKTPVNCLLFHADDDGAGPINTDRLTIAGDNTKVCLILSYLM